MKMQGKRTYVIGGLITLISVIYTLGFLEGEVFLQILGILVGTGAVTLRAAIANLTTE